MSSSFVERLKYTPIRLDDKERLMLEVLNQTLEVSEYTDVVDVAFSHTRQSKESRIIQSIIELFSTMNGLLLAINLGQGEKTVSGKKLEDNFPLYTSIFEIGRRYKIMNPSKMRNTYGKLMHIMMDLESTEVKAKCGGHSFFKDIETVAILAERLQIDEILSDPRLELASKPVKTHQRAPKDISDDTAAKKGALEELIAEYSIPNKISASDISRIVESVSDTWSYETFNVLPVKSALEMLLNTFDRDREEEGSLALSAPTRVNYGASYNRYMNNLVGFSSRFSGDGACLSHDHTTQFTFVKQSLMLWQCIMSQLPVLWLLADLDMARQPYRLSDTGQGYMRVQSCPRVSDRMSQILKHVRSQCSEGWVGLSVVHLGDRDVPNALVFIDKYVQVPRILAPLVKCVSSIEDMSRTDSDFNEYVRREWGGNTGLKKQILADFFKHGFDGSGDDGGSCIDGRLTSAWNWCSKIYKKPYYYVFMFTGFQGFDGDFK